MVKLPPLPDVKPYTYSMDLCYTAEQMQAYGQACRAAALEEAAKVCDERANGENDAQYCADRIRSLKS